MCVKSLARAVGGVGGASVASAGLTTLNVAPPGSPSRSSRASRCCCPASCPRRPTPSGSSESADGDVTFTVALLNEVDSFNPFLGIEAESYEMWALTYDYMITYSMKDMSPEPGLATEWSTSDDGLTWTFDIRSGVKWSDGQDLTAADIAYTYNRVLSGSTEGASWSSYLAGVDSVTAPDATTVVLKLRKPNAVLPLLPIPIVPEHVWKNVSGKAVKSYGAEPRDGKPVVGSGPFRLVEGTAGGSTYRFEANPDYWQGAPHIDRVVFRVYKSEDPAVQALIKGEVDFVEGISALQVKALQDEPGVTAHNGDSPGFDEIAFNTGSVDLETEEPIGDPNPAVLDPKFRHALGYALDLDQVISKVYQGAGKPGSTIVPPAYADYHWAPPAEEAFTYDPERAGELLDEAGYTVGPDGLRTQPDGSPLGTIRLAARSDSPTSLDTMNFVKEWLRRRRHRREGRDLRVEQAHRRDPGRQLRHLPVGLVRRAGPGLHAQLHDLRPARQLVGLLVLQQGVRRALRAAARGARRGQAAGPGQADAADPVRGLAVPRDGVQLDRRGRPQRPVRLLPAPARPGRHLARAVRRPQLPDRAPGRRRGQL